ncbi:Peptidase S24/S26A/S26B/S26C [Ophiocordyceps sinensis CO18]|uniref:Peptidase S24/S26A/S26B/S26C n=1 Tax=Ophiocordyceps sinensis (strain Co18 / CGMCC 3.14243) TaxID=911162 RepID=T5AAK2_OPHSC|nr:Peptidase S24/S26A/S26B/S26C [Ophiocordyceps sinensis CO18]
MPCLTHLPFSHLVQISPAQGPSMLPTFSVDGDWVLADMTARHGRRLRVGDLAIYKIPIFPSSIGAKRVIAMPGDYVSLGTPGEKGGHRMIQVPEGHCWVAGDNLPASRDSRLFGPLPLALVQGKIVAKILPWRERHWMDNALQPMDNNEP